MTLTQAISEFNCSGLAVRSPRQRHLEKAVDRVQLKADGLEVPGDLTAFDFEGAIRDLSQGQATRRQIKRLAAGGMLLIGESADGENLLNSLFGAVENLGRGLLKSLLVGYILARNPDSWVTARVRRFLVERKDHLPTIWRDRVTKYHLLSPDVGGYCSDLILRVNEFDPVKFARESGIRGVKAAGGVAYQIFRSLSLTLSEGHKDDRLDRYLRFVAQDEVVRFQSHVADYAMALLSPYVDSNPTEEKRSIIEQFMVERFGDPRLKPVVWAGVPDEQIKVIKRWLAKASLELLLNVVSESNDTSQWVERSRFWRHYFDQGLITEAWVALGPDAAVVARRLVHEEVITSTSEYGVLGRGGAQSHHSVLIFRLGDFVISEWTHSGKLRIYDIRNGHSPSFYQKKYNAHSIRSDITSNVTVIHHANWREKVSGFLRFELGVSPPPNIAPLGGNKRCLGCGQTLHVLWFRVSSDQKCTRCALKSHYV